MLKGFLWLGIAWLLSLCCCGVFAQGQDGVWTSDYDGSWSSSGNWQGGLIATGATRSASFTGLVSAARSINVDYSPWTIGYLNFSYSGGFNWTVNNGGLNLSSATGMPAITVNANTTVLNTPFTGSQGLAKYGAGTLVLNGTNIYTGNTVIYAGGIQLGNSTASGLLSTNDVTNSGVFSFCRTDTFVISNNFSGSGTFRQLNGAGQLTLTGMNQMATMMIGSGNSAKPLILPAGSSNRVNYLGFADGNVGTYGKLNIQTGAVLNCGYFHMGESSGRSGEAVQEGGDVTVSNQLRVGHYPNETSFYYMNGGRLMLVGYPAGSGPEYDGVLYLGIDGTGVFTQSGGVARAYGLCLDNRVDTPGTDTYTMAGGLMTLGAWGIYGNTSTVINLGGGTLAADADWSNSLPVNLTNLNGSVTIQAGDTNGVGRNITLSGVLSGSGGLIKTGSGSLILRNTNSYLGVTIVNGGILSVTTNMSCVGVTIVSNGVLDVSNPSGQAMGSNVTLVLCGGRLRGAGMLAGVVVGDGATISPGAATNAGTMTASDTVWSNAFYRWEVADFNGAYGAGWDNFNCTGTLTLAANMFTIQVFFCEFTGCSRSGVELCVWLGLHPADRQRGVFQRDGYEQDCG